MSEPFVGDEMSEELESTEELSREAMEFNEITNEPESYIEGKIDVSQSEAIESNFNELVDNQVSGAEVEMPALDGSSKQTFDSAGGDEGNNDPIPMPGPTDEVSCDPIPIPGGSTDEASIDPKPILSETGDTSIDPTPIWREAGEVGEENESLLKESAEEPAPLTSLDDLQSLAQQQQITQQNPEFTIVSVIMHSSGDTAKNSINNIR